MPAIKGLRSSRDFQRVYREGKGVGTRRIALRFLNKESLELRVGVVAGKELGSAVQRNRAKRLLREVCRLNQKKIRDGLDLVVIARKEMGSFSYRETEKEFLELLARARLLQETK